MVEALKSDSIGHRRRVGGTSGLLSSIFDPEAIDGFMFDLVFSSCKQTPTSGATLAPSNSLCADLGCSASKPRPMIRPLSSFIRPVTSTLWTLSTAATLAALVPTVHAVEQLTTSNITQVVKDVKVIQPKEKSSKAAKVNDLFSVPDIMRTGPDSRAEMVAPDQTVTRVGANTLFSFEPEKREINLQKGSILFNSPTGKGGGNIRTAAVTASVLGTTLVVGTTNNGGFKVMLLEGKGRIRTTAGKTRTLTAGQMVYALPGGDLSNPVFFRLSQQVATSALLGGFKKSLPSAPKIEAAIAKQEALIASGKLKDTGMLAGDEADKAYQSDVVSRESLIQSNRTDNSPLAIALRTDASVNSSQLNSGRLFTGRTEEFAPSVFRALFGTQSAAGFEANKIATLDFPGGFEIPEETTLFASRNTTFDFGNEALPSTQSSSSSGPFIFLPVNSGSFIFLATQDIQFNKQVRIHETDAPLNFLAGRSIVFKPNASLTLSAPDAFLGAYGDGIVDYLDTGKLPSDGGELTLDGSSSFIRNEFFSSSSFPGGNLSIFAPEITLLNGASISATGDLALTAGGDIRVEGFVVSDPISPGLPVTYSQSLASSSPTGTLKVRADGTLNLIQAGLVANRTSLEAQTINLSGVNFQPDTRIDLKSAIGKPTFGQSQAKPGHVNFIKNVFYGQTRVSDGDTLAATRSAGGGNGIYVSKK